MTDSDPTQQRIDDLVRGHRVVVFMKGTREAPRCGFSARVAGILDLMLPEYTAVDVLADEALREGVKAYAVWPTIPQLYVDGDFVGGCDIVQDLMAAGGLAELLGVEAPAPASPRVTITEAAAAVIRESIDEFGDQPVRLTVTASDRCDLSVGGSYAGDVRVASGVGPLVLDPFSAARADGLVVDYVRRGFESGFVISRPERGGVHGD